MPTLKCGSINIEDTSEAFEHAWFSNKAFHRRFGLEDNDVSSRMRKVGEEFVEFMEASTALDLGFPAKDELVEESADLIYTIFGVLQRHGIIFAELYTAMDRVAHKNDIKTTETHEVRKGQVVRKVNE